MGALINSSTLSYSNSSRAYYLWALEGKPITIQINLNVVDRMVRLVSEASSSASGRAVEVGGVLLGSVDHSVAEWPRIVIEGFEPVKSEYARGRCYVLSAKDRQNFGRKIASLQSAAGMGLFTIGYYRSHTRPGLYLSEDDFSLIRTYFSDPCSVFLLVKPALENAHTGGFFFWEGHDIHRHSTFLEFPFDRAQLEAEQPACTDGIETPSENCDRLPDQAYATERNSSAAGTAFHSETSEIDKTVPKESRSLVNLAKQSGVTSDLTRWIWILSAAAVLIAVLFFWRRRSSELSIPVAHAAFQDLGLHVEKDGRSLHLTWNRNDVPIQRATSGILWITDGADQQKLILDTIQLSTGSFLYWPASKSVNFRLEVAGHRSVTESIQTLVSTTPPVWPDIAPVSSPHLAQPDSTKKPGETAARVFRPGPRRKKHGKRLQP